MEVSDLEKSWADMSLAEEEAGGLEAPVSDHASGSVTYSELVGRFLSDRPIKFEQMQQVMASVWRPMMGMRVLPVNDNLFLFQFPHPKDLQRVLDDGPWSFENHTFVCKQLLPQVRPEDVTLDTVEFWVQIYELPAIYVSMDFIMQIGNYVGSLIAIDQNNFGGTWRSYFRVRVALKVNEPLKRRMKIRRRDGSFHWITFKYERLNTFCFCCGLLGHSDKFCRKAYEEGLTPKDYPYGAWLRAGGRRQSQPVGAKWLLLDLPATPFFVDKADAVPVSDPKHVEEDVILQGELKRRREGTVSNNQLVIVDSTMTEPPKNLFTAGPDSQARPTK